jgi:hypothetical protein
MNSDMLTTLCTMGPILLLIDILLLVWIFFTRRKVKQASNWPSVGGTVTLSTLREYEESDGYVTYPDVMYSYQVGGYTYQGSRIAPGQAVGGSGARKVIARYPVGSQVTVFYNPQNPTEAVLEKKAPALFLLWLMLIIFNLAFGCVVPYVVWSSQN